MVTALYQNLCCLFPGSRFYLLTPYPGADRRINRHKNLTVLSGTPLRLLLIVTPLALLAALFKKFKLPQSLLKKEPVIAAISEADLVFDVSGISFSDGRELYLAYNIVTLMPPLLLGKKVIKCSQAMGPFMGWINRASARVILPKLDHIFARGVNTKLYLDSLGLSRVSVGSDLAFCMDIDGVDFTKIKAVISPGDGTWVGISPSSVLYRNCKNRNIDYVRIMARFCDFLIEKWNFKVILIPHSYRNNRRRLKNNDLPVVRQIADAVSNKEKVIQIDTELSASELRVIIRECRFFVASRFHAMVSALSVSVPVIVCGWGHKYLEQLQAFDLIGFAIDENNLSFEVLVSRFEELVNKEAVIKKQIIKSLPGVCLSVSQHFSIVQNIFSTNAANA